MCPGSVWNLSGGHLKGVREVCGDRSNQDRSSQLNFFSSYTNFMSNTTPIQLECKAAKVSDFLFANT